jgi:hypothetical protein
MLSQSDMTALRQHADTTGYILDLLQNTRHGKASSSLQQIQRTTFARGHGATASALRRASRAHSALKTRVNAFGPPYPAPNATPTR